MICYIPESFHYGKRKEKKEKVTGSKANQAKFERRYLQFKITGKF